MQGSRVFQSTDDDPGIRVEQQINRRRRDPPKVARAQTNDGDAAAH
jgi:hypothetical protein